MPTEQDRHFMTAALAEAEQALASGEFPVGCVLVHEGEIVARGRRLNSQGTAANELDHAEIVALRKLFATRPALDRSRITAYSTMEPCLMCFATLLLNGIHSMVYGYEDIMGGGTNLPLAQLLPLYQAMRPSVIPHVLRQESVALFKRFFADPKQAYWQGSLLADYTLRQ
ncbi:MAG: nucleoside deaminase [Thermodesulfobacteriota bacterium]